MASEDLGDGGGLVGHGEEWRGAERRRPQSGGAAWHGHAGGDHATGHANIGMETFLSDQGSKQKTDRVTWCQIEFPTTL